MHKQTLRSVWLGLALIAGMQVSLGLISTARAQQFGAWTVGCGSNPPYQYTYCNVFTNKAVSENAGDVAQFAVTRTLGVERIGFVTVNGLAAGSRVVVSVDKSHTWTFEAPTDGGLALLVPTAESKKIIDQFLVGKTVTVTFTPAGRPQQALQVSLASFPEALKRAREKAR